MQAPQPRDAKGRFLARPQVIDPEMLKLIEQVKRRREGLPIYSGWQWQNWRFEITSKEVIYREPPAPEEEE